MKSGGVKYFKTQLDKVFMFLEHCFFSLLFVMTHNKERMEKEQCSSNTQEFSPFNTYGMKAWSTKNFVAIDYNCRAIFAYCGQFQCRMQDCSVKYSNGHSCDANIVILNPSVPLHSPCCAFLYNHCCHAWPNWLWSRHSPLETRQIRLHCMHECLCWCGLRQRWDWLSHCCKKI